MTHPLLEYYVRKAEEIELGIGLTLYVKGLIIEGITLSQKKYYEDMWTALTSANVMDESNRDTMDMVDHSLRDFLHGEIEKEREKTIDSVPEYIYLMNVKIYSGSVEEFTSTLYWIGKLSSIDGFNLGVRQDEGN